MHYYTYQITKTSIQKHYIGVRSSNISPMYDIGRKYFSSSTDKYFLKDQKFNPDDYNYLVLREFNTRSEAIEHEIYLHKINDVAKNPKFFNKARQTSTGFDTSGISKEDHPNFGKVYITDGDIHKRVFIEDIPDGWCVEGPSVNEGYKKFKKPDGTFNNCLPRDAQEYWTLVNPAPSHTVISNSKGYKMFQKPNGDYIKRLPQDAKDDWLQKAPSIGNNHVWFLKPDGTRTHCLSELVKDEWIEDTLQTGVGFKSYQKPDGSFTSCLPIDSKPDWILKGRTKGKVFFRYKKPDGSFVNRLEKNAKIDWVKVPKGTNK